MINILIYVCLPWTDSLVPYVYFIVCINVCYISWQGNVFRSYDVGAETGLTNYDKDAYRVYLWLFHTSEVDASAAATADDTRPIER